MLQRRTLTLLVLTCLGHVLLISAQVQSRGGLPVLQAVPYGAFARLQAATNGVLDALYRGWSQYIALGHAARDNGALRQRVVELEVELQRQQAVAARARDLEAALALRDSQPAPMLAARVVAGSPSPGVLTVTIDRGADDGIRPDMAVIESRGVVGRVIRPISARTATVQLLVGRNAAVAVTFERSGAGGLVLGGPRPDSLRTEFVPVLADVQIGERVFTSGQDGIFPQGFLVGVVETVSRTGSALDRAITVRPAVDFSHIGTVLVSLTPPHPAS